MKKMSSVFDKLKTRSFRMGGYSVTAAVFVLAICVALNVLVAALPTSVTLLDTTSQQLFTISDQTKAVVSGLEKDVEIYWLASGGTKDSGISALLERYQSMSKRIHVTNIDPDVYPTFVTKYAGENFEDNSLVVECGDKFRYIPQSEIYVIDLMTYYYTGETTGDFDGEGALTSAISYVTATELPKIYTLVGHGEADLTGSFREAVEKENYEMEELSLLTVDAVPEDADCVLMISPMKDISAQETEMLMEYLKTGGSFFVLSDLPLDDAGRPNLDALLAEYGILMQDGILMETDPGYYTFNTPYCILPRIMYHEITDPLNGGGYQVVLPIAQPMLVSDETRDSLDVSALLQTSNTAYAKLAGYEITTYEKEDGDTDGPFKTALAATDDNDDGSQARLVVVSASSLLSEDFNEQVNGTNQDFFLNALAWLSNFESGITIHSKSLAEQYLTIDGRTASVLTAMIVGVIPLAFLSVGIVVTVRRKRR